MKFTCISDTHGKHDLLKIPDADVIFHSGDCTGRGRESEIVEFLEWYGKLPHKHKVLIAGNHDFGFESNKERYKKIAEDNGIIYLQDSGCEIEGIKIWGSPQTPEFCDWAFNCWRTEKLAELSDRYEYIGKFWDMIPDDTDILITHGPPYDIMDKCPNPVGCVELRKKILEIKPKFHIFGHIHEGAGHLLHDYMDPEITDLDTMFINASSLDGRYIPYPWENNVYDYDTWMVSREE